MREARKIDSDGLERLRCQAIVDFRIKTADMNKVKVVAAARKAVETRRQIRKVTIATRTSDLAECSSPSPCSEYFGHARKAAKLEVLEAALIVYLSNISNFPLPHDPEADMAPEASTNDVAVVDDWAAEEDNEMEE
ncbi:hypothetical protein C8R47DRAFT_1209439 [Mycena vitilis]|nr:hypothetical protein C8R47DRAFT_1209439 [Mycena vitilis]